MKKWIKIGLSMALGLSVNFAYANDFPQRFEGCFIDGGKKCLFKDGTAIAKYDDTDEVEFLYLNYTLVDNLNRVPHTKQALRFSPILGDPTFQVYTGKNPYFTQGFHLTVSQFDKGYSQDEIFIDDKKLDFTTAKANPKRPDEIQFMLANPPKQIVLKKFISDSVSTSYTYQPKINANQIVINSYREFNFNTDFPATYHNGKLAIDFGKLGNHPFPLVTPSEAGAMWQEFLKVKAIKQRLKDYDQHIYVDRNGWFGYRRAWTREEEMESKLTDEQSKQLSQEIDEKLKNLGLIKLDLLMPTRIESDK